MGCLGSSTRSPGQSLLLDEYPAGQPPGLADPSQNGCTALDLPFPPIHHFWERRGRRKAAQLPDTSLTHLIKGIKYQKRRRTFNNSATSSCFITLIFAKIASSSWHLFSLTIWAKKATRKYDIFTCPHYANHSIARLACKCPHSPWWKKKRSAINLT